MSFEVRLGVLALAAFALGTMLGTVLLPWLAARVRGRAPRAVAGALFGVRLIPGALGAAFAALVVASYLVFEPRGGRVETTGVLLGGLAAMAAAALSASAARWWVMLGDTERLLRRWKADGRPISLPGVPMPAFVVRSEFPIVSVVGLFRPTLVIAESVLDACSPEELRAILAHEQGHVDRRDNLRRALMLAAPDFVAWLPVSKRVQQAWHAATEEAADDLAAGLGERGRPLLARALVTVAALTPSRLDAHDIPASALYRGEGLEHRVRRLLSPAEEVRPRSASARVVLAAVLLTAAAASLEAVHVIIEAAVHRLP